MFLSIFPITPSDSGSSGAFVRSRAQDCGRDGSPRTGSRSRPPATAMPTMWGASWRDCPASPAASWPVCKMTRPGQNIAMNWTSPGAGWRQEPLPAMREFQKCELERRPHRARAGLLPIQRPGCADGHRVLSRESDVFPGRAGAGRNTAVPRSSSGGKTSRAISPVCGPPLPRSWGGASSSRARWIASFEDK